ncbi:MAG: ribonuclease P protein component [Coriobacteriia bacterium]
MRTITANAEIDSIFASATRGTSPLLVVLSAKTPASRDPEGRVMFVAGKKIGGAVLRNRAKRVLRETCRRAGGPWPGLDVVFIARAGVITARPEALDASAAAALRKAGVLS